MKPASYLSLRFLRTGLIDTVLVVIALALAGSVLAACLSLMGSFDTKLKSDLNAPWYKEIVVSTRNQNASSAGSAVTKLSNTGNQNQRLSASDLASSAASSSVISSAYIINFETLNVGVGNFGGPVGGISIITKDSGPSTGSSGVTANVPITTQAVPDNATPQNENESPGTTELGGQTTNSTQGSGADLAGSADQGPPDMTQMQTAIEDLKKEAASLEQPLLTELQGARVSSGLFDAYGLNLAEGSLFTDEDMNSGLRVAVVGASLAKTLYSDGVTLGKKIMLRGNEGFLQSKQVPLIDIYCLSTASNSNLFIWL